jgi:hypothetical protein
MILDYRGYGKILSTYVENFLNNTDENAEAKFNLNQVQADTGRYSSTGGKGLNADGYCGVNCQNLPRYDKKDPKAVNLRKAVVARPGYKIATVDYSGEELRIGANFSKEPKWINEFLHGSADLHTLTAQILYNKKDISKEERSIGKTINFLTFYGGGAMGFAQKAKIPLETARKLMFNFFREYSVLNSWIKDEIRRCRKRGYSRTAFGRRRSLKAFYESTDKKVQADGDRRAVNSAVQGCLQPQEKCLTNKGYIPIYDIRNMKKEGVPLKVWTGTSWEEFDVLDRGKCQFAEIELENGMILHCDTRHQVLTVGEEGYKFTHFNDLDENTRVCTSAPREMEFGEYPKTKFYSGGNNYKSKHIKIKTKDQWEYVAFLLGVVIGDGWVRNDTKNLKYSITIFFGENDFKTYFNKLKKGVEDLGLFLSNPRRSRGSKGVSYTSDISSKAIVSLFSDIGYIPAIARNKRVPKDVFTWPLAMRKAFIKGYYDTDGCKKKGNRYGFHTPNKELLSDVQLIMWSIGIPSIVKYSKSDNTFKLECQSLENVENILGITKTEYKRKYNGRKNYVPDFLRKEIFNKLHTTSCVQHDVDRAYMHKIGSNKGTVTLIGALELMKKYKVSIDREFYYSYKLKRKTVLDTIDNTFTLSVHSPLHRFDSACIISKNTGADVIKIAMYRVWNYLRKNGFLDDVKILMPIHDEIVFEIKEDKLDFFIPKLRELMVLDDITKKLNWIVPLEVDAEYGDTLYVDHDYFKELKERAVDNTTAEPKQEIEAPKPELREVKTEQKPENSDKISNIKITSVTDGVVSTTTNNTVAITSSFVIQEDKPDERDNVMDDKAVNDERLKNKIDNKGFYIKAINTNNPQGGMYLKNIINTLSLLDGKFVGPRCRIKFVALDGTVIKKLYEKVSVDALECLCTYHNI